MIIGLGYCSDSRVMTSDSRVMTSDSMVKDTFKKKKAPSVPHKASHLDCYLRDTFEE